MLLRDVALLLFGLFPFGSSELSLLFSCVSSEANLNRFESFSSCVSESIVSGDFIKKIDTSPLRIMKTLSAFAPTCSETISQSIESNRIGVKVNGIRKHYLLRKGKWRE